MKLVKLYESVLREGAASGCIADFGKILFANQLGGDEPNTDIEDEHVSSVYNFTDFDFGENIKPEILDAVDHLHSCMSTYPEVLRPDVELVYRGTSAPIMTFIKNGAIPAKQEPSPYEYKANSPIQSWTENIDKAAGFGSGDAINKFSMVINNFDRLTLEMLIPKLSKIKIPVVLEYKTNSNEFLFKGKYLNQLSEFGSEDEVLRIDYKPITVNAYLNEKYLTSASRQLINKINELL